MIEKKHEFRGLDLRSNVLSRVDGSAGDCTNVLLDESRNLIKRKEFQKLNIPRGLNPESELHPDSEILGVVEHEGEILIVTYLEFDGIDPDTSGEVRLSFNKLYRVTSLLPSVEIEEIPYDSPNTVDVSGAPPIGSPLGIVNILGRSFKGSISFFVKNKILYFTGSEDGRPPHLSGGTPITLEGPPLVMRYDGASFHGAGVSEAAGLTQTPDQGTRTNDWYIKTFGFYIDNKGNQVAKEIATWLQAPTEGFLIIPNTTEVNLYFGYDPSITAKNQNGSIYRGGYFKVLGITEPGGTLYKDHTSPLPYSVPIDPVYPGIVKGKWVYAPQGSSIFPPMGQDYPLVRIKVGEVSSSSVEIVDHELYLEGRWMSVSEVVDRGYGFSYGFSDGFSVSSALMAIYASREYTFNYKRVYLPGTIGTPLGQNPTNDLFPMVPGTFSGSPTFPLGGSSFVSFPEAAIGYNLIDPYPGWGAWGPKLIRGLILSTNLEDWYAEEVIKINPPPMRQISDYSGYMMGHDGSFIYYSDSSLGSSPDTFTPFENFSVGKEKDGPIMGVFSDESLVGVFRKYNTYHVLGNLISGNFTIKNAKQTGIGCVSSSSIAELDGGITFSSVRGIHLLREGSQLISLSDKIENIFTKDVLDIKPILSKVSSFVDTIDEYLYVFMPGETKDILLAYNYYFQEWFKFEGVSFKGGVAQIRNEESPHFGKILVSDGEDLFLPIDTYIEGVDAFYSANYLTAGEPSLKKLWSKLVLFLVGSPKTELKFDSKVDWDSRTPEETTLDTMEISTDYVVDMKSFSPINAYSRSVEIISEGTNPLLVNGYQVTYDLEQDDVVDENL